MLNPLSLFSSSLLTSTTILVLLGGHAVAEDDTDNNSAASEFVTSGLRSRTTANGQKPGHRYR
jgi:hypothetical protein